MKETVPYIIALDGVSGSGKSSTAKAVAKELSIVYLDTGAMYRAVTHLAQEACISWVEEEKVTQLASSLQFELDSQGNLKVNGQDLSHAIRTPRVGNEVSDYCKILGVRQALVRIQQEIGSQTSSILDGRDIATVVFPNAQYKFYLWANPEVRAERRFKELKEKGMVTTYEEVYQNLVLRDEKDSTREHSPLQKVEDAELIDTSNLTLEEQVRKIVDKVRLDLSKE
jgi:cytidylate kinase